MIFCAFNWFFSQKKCAEWHIIRFALSLGEVKTGDCVLPGTNSLGGTRFWYTQPWLKHLPGIINPPFCLRTHSDTHLLAISVSSEQCIVKWTLGPSTCRGARNRQLSVAYLPFRLTFSSSGTFAGASGQNGNNLHTRNIIFSIFLHSFLFNCILAELGLRRDISKLQWHARLYEKCF